MVHFSADQSPASPASPTCFFTPSPSLERLASIAERAWRKANTLTLSLLKGDHIVCVPRVVRTCDITVKLTNPPTILQLLFSFISVPVHDVAATLQHHVI